MDKLPVYLVNSIENACNIFNNISFTIHGDESKARISIMFGQSESKQSRRKSKFTERRNNKRMENYIEKFTNTDDNLRINKRIVQGTVEILDDQLMEIETTNVRSTETDTVIDKCTLELQENKTQISNTHFKKVDVEKINKVTECAKLSETNEHRLVETMNTEENDTIMSTQNDKQEQSDKSDDDSDDDSEDDDDEDDDGDEDDDDDEDDVEKRVPVGEIISKAVIKKSRMSPDKFIAKIKGNEKLVKYDRGRDKVEEVQPTDSDYYTFMQNVEHDFQDVRNYEFRPDETDEKLLLIATFAIDNRLYVHKK